MMMLKKVTINQLFTIHGTNLLKNEQKGINFFNNLNPSNEIFYKTYSKKKLSKNRD